MNSHNKNPFPVPFTLFIGPQRSGTSWLNRYLLDRGDICLPQNVKETFYFNRHFAKGVQFYRSHFKIKPQHQLAIEISTTLFSDLAALQRIHDLFGKDVRLICPLRHPVLRSYSLYKHLVRFGMVRGNLVEAIQEMPEIVETSRYAHWLEHWFKVFGRENIKVSFQEHLVIDQEGYIKDICNSIGCPYVSIEQKLKGKYNATQKPPSLLIANITQKLENILRRSELYLVINFVKSLGLGKLVFGNANPDADPLTIPEEDKAYLEELLSGEIEQLENLLGYKIKYWEHY